MTAPTPCPVAVCAGSDCARDRRTEFKALLSELDGTPVVRTRCMGVCHGPVAVLDATGDSPTVIERIRSPKQARAVRKLAQRGGTAPKRLQVVGKAKKRRKAVSKAVAAIG